MPGTNAENATVGAEFQRARKRQSVTLDTVARDLNIGKEFLAAIENDDIQGLPEPAYAIGFVRSYSRYLDLDAAEMIVRFKAEALSKLDTDDLLFPTPIRENRFPVGLLAIICLVVAGLGYGSWVLYTQQSADQRADSAGAMAAAPAAKVKTAAAADAGSTTAVASKASTPAKVSAKVSSPPAAPATGGADNSADRGAVSAKVHAGDGKQRVLLRATSSTWIRIRDGRNAILFTRVLRQGDQYVVPKKAGVVVDIGNAGSLQIVLNGKVLKPVGPANMPVYNISLSPESLRKREEAARTGRNN
jgi:cytoskeleton protein RodZ